jgi:mannose-6-phosphate isomerase-like protein (cupin superfamily)
MLSTNKDMIISVVKSQKEAFIDGKPANFDPRIKTPTQKLTPVNTICWALTAWRRKKFVELFDSGQSPSFMENFDFFGFPLEECDDIDTYEELLVVEQRLRGKRLAHENTSLRYFDNNIIGIERELHKLLSNDGSALSRSALSNLYGKLSLASIIEEMGPSKSWSYPIMVDGQDQACLIQQIKGDQCRKHYHITKSEFWVVLQGTFEWILDDATYTVSKGEFMRLKPGQVHVIRSIGQQPGIRLAMGGYNMEHVYI